MIDFDDAVDVFEAQDLVVGAGFVARAEKIVAGDAKKNVVDECGFARTGDAGDADQAADGDGNVDSF